MDIFLGEPPANIKAWIVEHYAPGPGPGPIVPNGKVLYKTEVGREWLQDDADISNGIFNGFANKSNAVEVIIPSKDSSGNDITNIQMSVFEYCTGLTSVTIPDSVTNIGAHAFFGCSSLTNVTIGDRVTNIGDLAFYNCSGLTSVTIPNSITIINSGVFRGCINLTSVTFIGKTLEQVQNIEDSIGDKQYPWGISDTSIINVA